MLSFGTGVSRQRPRLKLVEFGHPESISMRSLMTDIWRQHACSESAPCGILVFAFTQGGHRAHGWFSCAATASHRDRIQGQGETCIFLAEHLPISYHPNRISFGQGNTRPSILEQLQARNTKDSKVGAQSAQSGLRHDDFKFAERKR